MEDEQDALRRLRALGLSEYAARAYAALLKLGKTDAKSISTLARVPPSKIYDVLATLESAGLLEVFPEFPKKYGPRTLEKHIDQLASHHRERAERIEAEREELLRIFTPSATGGQADDGGGTVVSLRGRARILERVHDMLNGAKSTWLALGSLGSPARLPHFTEELRAAHARGVTSRVLIPAEGSHPHVDAIADVVDLRFRPPTRTRTDHVGLFVADGRRALLVHWGSETGAPGAADSAIATDDEAMVSALESLLLVMLETHGRAVPVASSV